LRKEKGRERRECRGPPPALRPGGEKRGGEKGTCLALRRLLHGKGKREAFVATSVEEGSEKEKATVLRGFTIYQKRDRVVRVGLRGKRGRSETVDKPSGRGRKKKSERNLPCHVIVSVTVDGKGKGNLPLADGEKKEGSAVLRGGGGGGGRKKKSLLLKLTTGHCPQGHEKKKKGICYGDIAV